MGDADIIVLVTLILTLVDKNKMVQVSDRRLTKFNGEVHNDNVNKAVCIGMSHLHFAVAYTGLAYIGSARTENRTDYWLLEHLGSITRNKRPTVENICRSFSEQATRTLSHLPGTFKPLEVVLAGYDLNNRGFRATISNMKVNEEGFVEVVRKRFVSDVRWFYPWSPKPELYVAGVVPAFQANDPVARALKTCRDKVVQYLKVNHEKLTEERVSETLSWLTRAAHTHKDYGHLVGRDCLSVVAFPRAPRRSALMQQDFGVPKKPNETALFTSLYHPVAASSIHYAPHLADWYMDYMNVHGDTDPEPPEGHDAPPSDEPPKFGSNLKYSIKVKGSPSPATLHRTHSLATQLQQPVAPRNKSSQHTLPYTPVAGRIRPIYVSHTPL